jgi:hypothetical protein
LQLSDGGELPIFVSSDGIHAMPTGDGGKTTLGAAQTEIGEGPRKVGEERVRVGPNNGEPLSGDGFGVGRARLEVGGAWFGVDQGGDGFVVGHGRDGIWGSQGRDGFGGDDDQVNVQGTHGNWGAHEWSQEADGNGQNHIPLVKSQRAGLCTE